MFHYHHINIVIILQCEYLNDNIGTSVLIILTIGMKEWCRMDRQGDGSYASIGFIVEKWSCREGPQQESWSPQPLTDWG
jgi:hypothetical protein